MPVCSTLVQISVFKKGRQRDVLGGSMNVSYMSTGLDFISGVEDRKNRGRGGGLKLEGKDYKQLNNDY